MASASGVIGQRLVGLLRNAGHRVTGTTRSRSIYCDVTAWGPEPAWRLKIYPPPPRSQ